MKKRVLFLLSVLAMAVFVSCDLFDADDTQIVIKNASSYDWSFPLQENATAPYYITAIEIKEGSKTVYYNSGISIGPGDSRTVSLSNSAHSQCISQHSKRHSVLWGMKSNVTAPARSLTATRLLCRLTEETSTLANRKQIRRFHAVNRLA